MSPAHDLADIAADKLARLSTDMRHDAADPARSDEERARRASAIAESRREAASALRRLSEVARKAGDADAAHDATLMAIALESDTARLDEIDRWAAAWRAFADAA